MARKLAFDKDIVIYQAMTLFQERGYEATSIRDLVAHLGVSSSSLYSTFGDKDELFMLALKRHAELEMEALEGQLSAPAAPQEIIQALFDEFIDQLMQEGFPTGSLTLKAATELSVSKPAVASFLGQYMGEMTALLAAFLDKAAEEGQMTFQQPTADVARYLLFALFNLSLMVTIHPERAKLEGYKKMVLQTVLGG